MKRGQYYRLLLATTSNPSKVIAAAKEMSIHFAGQTEESSTKDTTGDVMEYEIVGQSYDITGSALILTPSDALNTGANSLNDMIGYVGDTLLYWKICLMEGDNQRTVDEPILSGTAKLTQLTPSGTVKQNATYQYTLNGYGAVTVAPSTT